MTTMQEFARRWVIDHDEAALAEYCQREAARLDAEESMSETTEPTTFEFDINSFGAIVDPHVSDYYLAAKIAGDVIGEYQRQMAEAGFVVGRREDTALRERAERLRRFVRVQLGLWDDDEMTLEAAYKALEADDLDDDLVPSKPERE